MSLYQYLLLWLDEEDINIPGLKKLIGYLTDGGVHGIFTLIASGEFARLKDE